MQQGRHTNRRSARAIVIVSVVAGVVLLGGGAAFSAHRYEQARADVILPGVTVGGVDVGGMTRAEAIDAVDRIMALRLGAPVLVSAAGKTWTVSPAQLGQEADIGAGVDRALGIGDSMGTFARFWHRVRRQPVGVSIDVDVGDPSGIPAFLTSVAGDVRVQPVDAAITERDGRLAFVKPKLGRALAQKESATLLRSALSGRSASVTLPMRAIRPGVTPNKLGRTIVVRVDQNRLYLYRGFTVERTYPVATAKPGFTTPVGDWRVSAKAVNPVWHNPALDSWGAGEPAVVPGGPGNPMGPRALYLSAPGLIRIHGNADDSSIGHYESHGCIRMHNWDVEQLYPLIPVGTHVIIVGVRPY